MNRCVDVPAFVIIASLAASAGCALYQAGNMDAGSIDGGGGAVDVSAYIKASNTGAEDQFGLSLSLSADGMRLAVGAGREDSSATGIGGNQADNRAFDSGAVYVFSRTGTTWTQEAYVKASNTEAESEFFGSSVSGERPRMKKIVISGGNSGIGLEAARQLVAKGHHVILLGRDRDSISSFLADPTRASLMERLEGHAVDPGELVTLEGRTTIIHDPRGIPMASTKL